MLRKILPLCCLFLTLACNEAVEFSAPLPDKAEPAEPAAMKNAPPLLPAYQLPWERKIPGKADAYDDYRKLHPQWFAITEPPQGNFRPMREWEPMQSILFTYSNGVSGMGEVADTLIDSAVASLAAGEIWVIADGNQPKQSFKNRMKLAGVSTEEIDEKVVFFDIESDAFWHIDYGPFPLVSEDNDTVAFGDWVYYHQRIRDDAIPTRLGNLLGITTYRSPFPFEGGNFQADGEEFCYFGERTYLYTGMSFDDVHWVNENYFGCKKSVVLKEITNDGTGHIDMFFKLGGKHVAVVGEYTVVDDPTNKQRMDDVAELLESLEYSDGSGGIEVFRLPFPNPAGGVPRTFINSTLFVSADGETKLNLWPMYTVDKDLEAEAIQVWEEAMPDWQHIGIISDEISKLSGAVHCVTRTVPALPLEKWVDDGECVDGMCQGEDGAYHWTCIPPYEDTPGCWGPKWACMCNNCNSAACKFSDGCGDGTCAAGENCFTCWADCGCEGNATCNLATESCDECGNGTCDEGENCSACAADCPCESGTACSFGVCTAYPCGGIGYEGCCDGTKVVYCEYGSLKSDECGGNGCGWNAGGGIYDCGSHASDPSGELPLSCSAYDYPSGCAGKQCGDNGAGYSCGECEGKGEECVDGQCFYDCEPDCEGKACGSDGCEGSCGECGKGEECVEGACTMDAPDGAGEPDVVTSEDIAAEDVPGSSDADEPDAGEVAAEKDDSGGGGGGGGCSHTGTTAPATAPLLLALLAALAATRRYRTHKSY